MCPSLPALSFFLSSLMHNFMPARSFDRIKHYYLARGLGDKLPGIIRCSILKSLGGKDHQDVPHCWIIPTAGKRAFRTIESCGGRKEGIRTKTAAPQFDYVKEAHRIVIKVTEEVVLGKMKKMLDDLGVWNERYISFGKQQSADYKFIGYQDAKFKYYFHGNNSK